MACLPHRYAFRCTFSPRKGLIFHNPVIKGRRWERTSRRDVSGNKVARNYYRSACFGGSEDRAKGWTRVRSRVIKFTATPPVQCYRLTPTCATYDATTLPFHDSRQQRRTRPPRPPPATAYALIGAAHAHNKRVHAKERTRLSDPSYKTRHPLDPSSRIHGELVESTRERGRGWRREFYTILALPHARSPSTPRHGPLLVNELSKHRVFVVRTNRWTLLMRGTEEEREGNRENCKGNILYFASF